MNLKLEVVVVPVSDVDRAKLFYQQLGFREDVDYVRDENYRCVHLTPPGSEASIIFGKGVTAARPGSLDRVLLAVDDIEQACHELRSKGVDVSEVFHDAAGGLGGGWYAVPGETTPGPDPQHRSYGTYASFRDPDGNVWLLQEVTERLPGRVEDPYNGSLQAALLDALKKAAAAHGEHEKETGAVDPDWPAWYAEHMARTLRNARPVLAAATR